LLERVAHASESRVHLVGHSYGAQVMLSAVTNATLPRPIHSMLLLQPAVSRLCFARDVGTGRAGGYRQSLPKIRLPILSTFTRNDVALYRFYHWALRRKGDLGGIGHAGSGPSRYAALGGHGPGGCSGECRIEPLRDVGDWYRIDDPALQVLGLNSDEGIRNHGDINNRFSWWALHNLVHDG
jgi:pimeloyl-ACP methyl ester carboxylesterase